MLDFNSFVDPTPEDSLILPCEREMFISADKINSLLDLLIEAPTEGKKLFILDSYVSL